MRSSAGSGSSVMNLLESVPAPVIACVDGYALGGGCELAMAADFIYATSKAVFGQPEVLLGLIPGFGGCVRLQQLVGPGLARELIYSGRKIDAAQAQRIGLVNEVFESREDMLAAAARTLREIAGTRLPRSPCARPRSTAPEVRTSTPDSSWRRRRSGRRSPPRTCAKGRTRSWRSACLPSTAPDRWNRRRSPKR